MTASADLVVETKGLRKEFRSLRGGRHVAVDNLDLEVARGSLHGFLGPNGAGKTTVIRMLVGLVRPSGGTIRVLGESYPQRMTVALAKVGAVVGGPRLNPAYTGRQILRALAAIGHLPSARADEAIELVGLSARGNERYQSYPLEHRQRLAIGVALLKRPELMILDEPTSGLDVIAIRKMRALVQELNASGITVLLCTQALPEVQEICDAVTIVGHGHRIRTGPLGTLVGRPAAYRVDATDPVFARRLLVEHGFPVNVRTDALVVDTDDSESITRALGAHDIWVTELSPIARSLESAFLDLLETDESTRDTP